MLSTWRRISCPVVLLVWAVQSETTNPDSLDAFARDVVKAAVRGMTRAGVLAEPS